jgi:hypothetical protein
MGREEFKRSLDTAGSARPPNLEKPWLPFCSREDFQFAEIAHQAAMNQPQIDALIKFIRHCEQNPGLFTLESFQDLKKSWEKSSALLTNVSRFPIHRCAPDVPFSSHSPFNSSSVTSSNSRTMMSNTSSKAGRAPSGTGSWITFKTKISSVSLNGMHKGFTSLMGKISRVFTPNHGTQIVFGRLKSVLTARLFNVTNIYFDPV